MLKISELSKYLDEKKKSINEAFAVGDRFCFFYKN